MSADVVDRALRRVLRPGQDVVVGQGYGEPRTLIDALARHPDLLHGSRVLVGMLLGDLPLLPGTAIETFFPSGPLGTEDGLRERRARYARQSLHALASDFALGRRRADVVLASGTPPRDGRPSLGIAVDYAAAAAAEAAAVVVEVDPGTPWTGRRSVVPAGPEVLAVPAAGPVHRLQRPAAPRDEAMAAHAAPFVPDGATLQLGMGPWATALAARLTDRRGLRIHSGLVSDWARQLEAAGALTTDPVRATGAGGSAAFYAWLDATDRVQLCSAVETHEPEVLAALPALHAVNSVLEVDLAGRANCEIGAGGRRGGIGGLTDFALAAAAAPDGLSMLVLASTRPGASRIVPRLDDAAVALPASAVDVVVTEHGAADLRGLTAAARADALIAVADPSHRAALTAEAAARALTP